jgi:sulfur-carrier protein
MPKVSFTSALKRFYPNLEPIVVEATTVAEILPELEKKYAGLSDFLVDEDGCLRQHINIFIGDCMVADRELLADKIREKDEILIFQALSGG